MGLRKPKRKAWLNIDAAVSRENQERSGQARERARLLRAHRPLEPL
jgi:hypothetical protein